MVYGHGGSLYARFGYNMEASSWSASGPIRQGAVYDCMWGEIQRGESLFARLESLFSVSVVHLVLVMILISVVRYKPGDVVIFRSPYLFHAISRWSPGPMVEKDKCTPGRVSWVHFTHASVHDQLEDKEDGYFRTGGQMVS